MASHTSLGRRDSSPGASGHDRQEDVLLTPREEEVLAAIAAGLTNQEVSAQLGIAPATAKRHREHLRDKLGLRKSAELAAWYARLRDASASAALQPATPPLRRPIVSPPTPPPSQAVQRIR